MWRSKNIWLRSLLGTWLGRRHAPIQTRKEKRAGKSFKPRLEILEDRLAPTVNLFYSNGNLTLEAANSASAPTTITASASSGKVAIFTAGDPGGMYFPSGTPSGFALTTFTTAGVTYSALTTTATISNLDILGPGGKLDTADTVNLGSVSLISSLGESLVVSAGTINFAAGAVVTAGSNNPLMYAGTINFPAGNVTLNGLDAYVTGTINFEASSVVDVGSTLNASAGTINFQGTGSTAAQVDAATMSLTSVNSLTFASTGVPYVGSVKIHDGPPSGQPFAGDPFITGPDWGTYGYAPGDKITISNATGNSGTYTIDAIVGDNLYLDSSSSTSSGDFPDATVQASGFIPEIKATSLTMIVTGAGSTISGAVSGTPASSGGYNVVLLNAATAGGNITLQDLPSSSATLILGTLNAGTGTIQLAVNGTVWSGAFMNYIFSSGFAGLSFSSYANVVNLTASAVDLTTTGLGSDIGFAGGSAATYFPITIQSGVPGQSLELTAATNDGSVYLQDSSPAGLTINSVVADQGGQAPTVVDGQIVYNNNPGGSTPTYASGTSDVVINAYYGVSTPAPGPVVLNSVSATGSVSITGEYILEGNAQSPNIIAQSVDLFATGAADYQGQVAFAQSSSGDTLTMPTTGPNTWGNLGFATNGSIVVSGALASADNGVFTIKSVSAYTLTLTQSFALTPEEQTGITVGDGMIGQTSAAVALADVPLFDADTNNGDIYLALGGGVDSTAEYVYAGGRNGMTNGVSVTSQADFLTIEDIKATGEAAVAMNGGSLIEYNSGGEYISPQEGLVSLSGLITGQIVSLSSPYNIGTASAPILTDAASGLAVAATATSPSSAGIDVDNIATSALTAVGVSTYDGGVTIVSAGGGLSFDNNQLSETGNAVVTFANMDNKDGSAGDVVVSGTVYVSSIVAGIDANGNAGAGQILTNPTTSGTIDGDGGTVILSAGSGIGTSGTSADIANVATLDATTNTGVIDVTNGTAPASTLTLSASTSAGDIDVTWKGNIDLSSEMSNTAGVVLNSISAPGTVTLDAIGGAILDEYNSTVSASTLIVTAANGIGTASAPLETTSRSIMTLTAATTGGGLFLDSSTALTVESATEKSGNLAIQAAGNLILLGQIVDPTGNVSLTATAGALATGNVTSSAAAIAKGQQTVIPTIMESYITVGAQLQIDTGTAYAETVYVTAVTPTTFTATFGNIHAANFTIGAAAGSVSPDSVLPISAGNLTITALQIGSPSDVVQTKTTTINATASDGGIYLSNNSASTLTLTAAAVGTASGLTANNIEIYSAGKILLQQQSTTLTQLATTIPVALFSPGGALTLFAGATLTADGKTVSGSGNQNITSSTPPATATSTLNTSGGVSTVSVGASGLGYQTAPQVTFSTAPGDTGSGAAATAVINALGQVTGFIITNAGTGYTSAPTVILSPPGDDVYTGSYDINGTTAVSSTSPAYLQALVIISNTAEVTPPGGGSSAIPALVTLADLTTLAAQTLGNGLVPVLNGTETVATTSGGITTVTIVAAAITIDDLGQNGNAGTAVIPNGWSLVLDATDGNIVFLNLADTIKVTGPGTLTTGTTTSAAAITATGQQSVTPRVMEPYIFVGAPLVINAGQADQETVTVTAVTPTTFTATFADTHLTNFTISAAATANSITVEAGTSKTDVAALGNLTTGGGSILVSAGGNIAIGTFTAGVPGFPPFGTISVTTTFGGILLNNGATPNATASKMTLTEATQPVSSAQSAALAELHATEVIAAADAAYANAVAAADAAGAQAAAELSTVNAFQAALTSIQAEVTTANQTYQADVQITNTENNTVNSDTNTVNSLITTVTNADGVAAVAGLIQSVVSEIAAVEGLALAATYQIPIVGTASEVATAGLNLVAATIGLVSASASADALRYQVDLNQASNTLSNDSSALGLDQANQAQAAAQLYADMDTEAALTAAYDVAEQAYTASQQAFTNDQATSALVEAEGKTNQANAIAGVVFASPSQPLNATATGSGPVYITAQSPLTISSNITSDNAINLTAAPDDPGQDIDDLTVNSGVTVQSTFLPTDPTTPSVSLFAGNDVDIESGATIEADSPIAITANLLNDTTNGATVTVAGTLIAPSASIGVPSNATGPETFNITPSRTTPITVDGDASGSGNTLNINAEGLSVTISGNTITVGTLAPVTFANIQDVTITNGNGSVTLDGTSGKVNTMNLVGTGQEAGTATLNGVAFAFSSMTSFNYQGGGSGDAIAVTPYANQTIPWNLAVSVGGGTGTPATLTYYAAGPNDTVTATGNDSGSVVEQDKQYTGTIPFTNVNQVTIVYNGVSNVEKIPDLTVTDADGTYNANAFSATALVNGAASLDGIMPTLTYYSGSIVTPAHQLSGAPVNVGTYTVVAAFAGDATYVSATTSTTFTIAKAPLMVTATGSATYGDAAATEGFIASGFVGGESYSVLGGTPVYVTSYTQGDVAGTNETVDVSGLTASNYVISYVQGTFPVAQAALTVTATGSATYGDADATEGYTGSGFVLGQDASVLGGTAAYITTYTQGDAAGTNETVSVSGLTSNNYAISYVGGTFTVSQAALTITATGSATYGDALPTDGFTGSGFVLGQDASFLGGTATYLDSYVQGDAAATSETVSVSGLTSSNYAITFAPATTYTVSQAALTITATGSATYGDALPTDGFTGSGFVLGQDASFLGGTATYLDSYVQGDAAATSETVSVSGLTSSNYTISYVDGTFTVAKADATVVVTPYTVPYDGLPHTATYTITGVNGETGATVGTVDVSNTTHTKAGVYTSDTWSFPGTANYNSIANTTITDVINPGALSQFVFSTIASPQTAGASFTVTITAEDAYGNTVTNFGGTTSVTSNGTLLAPITASFVNGVDANQSVTLTSAQSGTTLTTNDGSGHTGTSNTFTVNAAAAASLAVSAGNNQSSAANTAFATSLAVIVKDRYGNVVPGASVQFATPSFSHSGTFTGGNTTISVNANSSGVAAAPFTANIFAGSYTVSASTSGVAGSAKFSLTNLSSLGTSANAIYVHNLYALLLGRLPDPGAQGLLSALNSGLSPTGAVQALEGSREYLGDVVKSLYLKYLSRPADAGGLNGFVSLLAGGATIEQVIGDLVGSPEYFARHASNNTQFVQGLYQDILGRSASNAEVSSWLGVLAGGTSRTRVALDFLGSTEYRTKLVDSYYLQYLGRPADPNGQAVWVRALASGMSDQAVLAALLGSVPEGYEKWS